MPDAVPNPTLADLDRLWATLTADIRFAMAETGSGRYTPALEPARLVAEHRPLIEAALRAALAASPARTLPEPPPITDDSDYFPNTDFERWHADAAESPARSREEPGLDVERLARAMREEGIAPFRSRSAAEAHGDDPRWERNARDLIAAYDRLASRG